MSHEILLGLLRDAKGEISKCFNQQIKLVQDCEEKSKKETVRGELNKAHLSLGAGLNAVVDAAADNASVQIAITQLEEISTTTDELLGKLAAKIESEN